MISATITTITIIPIKTRPIIIGIFDGDVDMGANGVNVAVVSLFIMPSLTRTIFAHIKPVFIFHLILHVDCHTLPQYAKQ